MSPDAFLVPTLVTYRMLEVHGRAAGLPRSMQAKVRGVFDNALAGLEAAVFRAEVQSPLEIVQSATIVGARLLGLEGRLGIVEPGAFADLPVLQGNPLDDIGVLSRPGGVTAVLYRGEMAYANTLFT